MTAATPLAEVLRDIYVRVVPNLDPLTAFSLTSQLVQLALEVENLEDR